MFKRLLQGIIEAKDKEDAIQTVFYGGRIEGHEVVQWSVELAYQHGKISWGEHEMLFNLIQKMA